MKWAESDQVSMDTPLLGIHDSSERPVNARTKAFKSWFDAPLTVQNIFTPWDPEAMEFLFNRLLPTMWGEGRVPMVTWEPFTATPQDTPGSVATDIVEGRHDNYAKEWADRLQARVGESKELLLRFAHEPNGHWYPWCSPDYVEMWKRVRDIFESRGVGSKVQWLWAVNHVDTDESRAEELYPGDEYVDWVGVNGFNLGSSTDWSTWTPPHEVFDDMVNRLRNLTDKRLCIPEVASTSLTEKGHEPSKKGDWIRNLFSYVREKEIQMTCWFNVDKEEDWAVFGGERGTERFESEGHSYQAYTEFREAATTTLSGMPKEETP